MPADAPGALGPALEAMPRSLQAFEDNMQATASFVICDFGGGISEVQIAEALVSKAFCCSDKAVCQKMLDVAITARVV